MKPLHRSLYCFFFLSRAPHRAVSVTGGSRLYTQPRVARMDPVVALAPQSGTAGRRQLSVGSRVRQAHDRSTDHPHYPTSCPRFSRTAGERARRRHGTRGAGRWLVSRRPFAAPLSLPHSRTARGGARVHLSHSGVSPRSTMQAHCKDSTPTVRLGPYSYE